MSATMPAMNGAHILDLDGTLLPSHAVDNRCYWAAVGEVFQAGEGTLDLGGFRIVTDNGILDEWCRETLHRAPLAEEIQAVRSCFLRLIEEAAVAEPAAFRPLPGVEDWLERQACGAIAIATGGWAHTARFKLEAAGLDALDLPLAGADQGSDREDIMRHARSLLAPNFHDTTPTYIGDGPWDAMACANLGWPFIGIASGDRALALESAGAELILPDFRPLLSAEDPGK